MADNTVQDRTRDQLREFRRVVANAVAELRSQQIRDTFASISIEELMDQHVARLEGTEDPTRRSRLARIRQVHKEFTDNIEGMKATDPSQFQRTDPDNDANTAVEPPQ